MSGYKNHHHNHHLSRSGSINRSDHDSRPRRPSPPSRYYEDERNVDVDDYCYNKGQKIRHDDYEDYDRQSVSSDCKAVFVKGIHANWRESHLIDFMTYGFEEYEQLSRYSGCPITKCKIIPSYNGMPTAYMELRCHEEVESLLQLQTMTVNKAGLYGIKLTFQPWKQDRRRSDKDKHCGSLDRYGPSSLDLHHHHRESSIERHPHQEPFVQDDSQIGNTDDKFLSQEYITGTKVLVWSREAKKWTRDWLVNNLEKEMKRYGAGFDSIVDSYQNGSRWVIDVINTDLAMKLRKKLKYTRGWWVYGFEEEGNKKAQDGTGNFVGEEKYCPPSKISGNLKVLCFERPPNNTDVSGLHSFLNDHLEKCGMSRSTSATTTGGDNAVENQPIVSITKHHGDALETCWVVEVASEGARERLSSLDDTKFLASTLSFQKYIKLSFSSSNNDTNLDKYSYYQKPSSCSEGANTTTKTIYDCTDMNPEEDGGRTRPSKSPNNDPTDTNGGDSKSSRIVPGSITPGTAEWKQQVGKMVQQQQQQEAGSKKAGSGSDANAAASESSRANESKNVTKLAAVQVPQNSTRRVSLYDDDHSASLSQSNTKSASSSTGAGAETTDSSILDDSGSPVDGDITETNETSAGLAGNSTTENVIAAPPAGKSLEALRLIQQRAEILVEQEKVEEVDRIKKDLRRATKLYFQEQRRTKELEQENQDLVEKKRKAEEALQSHEETTAIEMERIKRMKKTAVQEMKKARKVAETAVQEMKEAKSEEKHSADKLVQQQQHSKQIIQVNQERLKSVTQQMEEAKSEGLALRQELETTNRKLDHIHHDWQNQCVELKDVKRQLEKERAKLERERSARLDMERRYKNVTESLAVQTTELAQERVARRNLEQQIISFAGTTNSGAADDNFGGQQVKKLGRV